LVTIGELSEALELSEQMASESNLAGSTSEGAGEAFKHEMGEIVSMLEEERSELEEKLRMANLELADHRDAIATLQTERTDSEDKQRALEESLAILQASAAGPTSADADDGTVNTVQSSVSNASSMASFVGVPGTDANPLSPGLTPRSERESEDMVAYFEGVVKGLKEENAAIKDRAKKERRRRKEAEEAHLTQQAAKDRELKLMAEEHTKEMGVVKEELKRVQDLVSKSNKLVEDLRSEKRGSIQRTMDVVMGGGGASGGGSSGSNNSGSNNSSSNNNREIQRAWNNSPANTADEGDRREGDRREGDNRASTQSLPPPFIPLPKGTPPPKRSHDRQWLNEKLKKMGVRTESADRGDGATSRSRRGSKNSIAPFSPEQEGDNCTNTGRIDRDDIGGREYDSSARAEERAEEEDRRRRRERQERKKEKERAKEKNDEREQQEGAVNDFWLNPRKASIVKTTKGAKVGLNVDMSNFNDL
jgi:hypothetical protein